MELAPSYLLAQAVLVPQTLHGADRISEFADLSETLVAST